MISSADHGEQAGRLPGRFMGLTALRRQMAGWTCLSVTFSCTVSSALGSDGVTESVFFSSEASVFADVARASTRLQITRRIIFALPDWLELGRTR